MLVIFFTLQSQNASTATNAVAGQTIANSTNNLIDVITSTGYSGTYLTNGIVGQTAASFTNALVPYSLGTNNIAAINIDTSQNVYIPNLASAQTITNTSGKLQKTNGVFNVQAYGAKGDGSTDDTSTINAAITALQAFSSGYSGGVLYFPAGTYKISSALAVSISNPQLVTICGDRKASIILQTASAADGLTITIAHGSGNTALASVEVCDLSFSTNTTAANAITITYGSTGTGSSEATDGVRVHDINIYNNGNAASNTQGWTNGIYLYNIWKAQVSKIFGCGGATSGNVVVHDNTTPSTGGSTPGQGACIAIFGTINTTITDIQAEFWQYAIYLGAPPGGGVGPQGVFINNFICVAVYRGLYQNGGTYVSNIQCNNMLIDQGNSPYNSGIQNIAIDLNNSSGAASGWPLNNNGFNLFNNIAWTQLGTGYGIYMANTNYCQFSNLNAFANGSGGAVYLNGGCSYNTFSNGYYGGGTITLTSTCSGNAFNNIGGSTFTNSGTNNISKTTLF